MSAAAHLSHLVLGRPSREGYLVRLRVRARRAALDRRLAAGVDPAADADLRRRAEELTEGEARRQIAMVIRRLVSEAAGPPPPFSSKAPLARAAILACAPRLGAIAGRLESDHVVAVRGVAQAAMLIHEGAGPLYSVSTPEVALRHRLAEIATALEDI
jgi:hypothetical protein